MKYPYQLSYVSEVCRIPSSRQPGRKTRALFSDTLCAMPTKGCLLEGKTVPFVFSQQHYSCGQRFCSCQATVFHDGFSETHRPGILSPSSLQDFAIGLPSSSRVWEPCSSTRCIYDQLRDQASSGCLRLLTHLRLRLPFYSISLFGIKQQQQQKPTRIYRCPLNYRVFS